MHIYGPPDRFGPPTPNGLCGRSHLTDYLALRQQLGLARTVYVQPSHYAHDNSCMLAAMAASITRLEMETKSKTARVRVIECATVNAVTILMRDRMRRAHNKSAARKAM